MSRLVRLCGVMDESKQALSAFVTTVSVKAGLIDPHIISGIGPSIRSVSDIDFSRFRYRSMEYDTSRDPQNPHVRSQVLFRSLIKPRYGYRHC
jgi:hypothetical protein